MAFNREKFRSMVHYVISKTDPAKLGATKLNKICWLADFTAYYRTGASITDAVYIKRQFGPVPRSIVSAINELEQDGSISVSDGLYFGKIQKRFDATRQPDMSQFTRQEVELIDSIVDYVSEHHTATSISDLSHDHIWKTASDGEEMPYYTVFANPVPVSDLVREWAIQELEEIVA